MKSYKKLNHLIIILLIQYFFGACVKDSDFSTPNVECTEPLITVTNTIAQVKEMYTFGGATLINTDVVIEGYVVSSDKSGNIYKSLSIQDKPKNPTSAIKIAIDQTDIYTKFDVGRKVYVQLKGLAIGYSYGSIQIGKAKAVELGSIPALDVPKHIIRSCETVEITPKKVAISDLTQELLEMLIEIENVQFKTSDLGKSFGNIDNTSTVNRILEGFDSNCQFNGQITLRNSGYANFKNELLPNGKGTLIGIFSNYYDDFQFYLRNTDDLQLTNERCDYSTAFNPTITLSEIKQMYTNTMVEFGTENNYIVEAYVISSDENGNFENSLYIQDAIENPTTGIQLLLDQEAIFDNFNVGDKIYIKLDKLYMNNLDGVLTIGYPKGNKITKIAAEDIHQFIFNSGVNKTLVPTEITISEINNPTYNSILVKVNNVQLIENELGKAYTYFTGENDAFRTLETCSELEKLLVFTNGNATFANEQFPKGNGSIIGILNTSLQIRNTTDVEFLENFETCPVIIPKIMITEVADPKNEVSARFIELYNAGKTEINLSGWKLNKYINGSTTVSSGAIDLTGITILPGDFAIIANTGYATIFSDIPNIESSYISGNGDDVYELVDNLGNTMDIFGIIGEDGNATNWEYLDGRAIRNLEINEPSPIFTISEWTIFSNAANDLISYPNSPKNAPNDYTPNLR